MSGKSAINLQRRPNRAALAIAAGLAALGTLLIWQGMVLPDKSGYAGIGSGAAPKAVGAGLILLAVGHIHAATKETIAPHSHQNWQAVIWIVLGLLAQLILLKPLGFSIASAVLFACTARAMGYHKLTVALGVGLILALCVYGVFDGLLQLNLPAGYLETLVYKG